MTLQKDFWQSEFVQDKKCAAEMRRQSCCQGDFALIVVL